MVRIKLIDKRSLSQKVAEAFKLESLESLLIKFTSVPIITIVLSWGTISHLWTTSALASFRETKVQVLHESALLTLATYWTSTAFVKAKIQTLDKRLTGTNASSALYLFLTSPSYCFFLKTTSLSRASKIYSFKASFVLSSALKGLRFLLPGSIVKGISSKAQRHESRTK